MTNSTIQKSQLEGALRLDAEYYQPEYLNIKDTFSKIKNVQSLKDVAKIICGPAYSSEQINYGFDIPLAKIGNVTNKVEIENWEKLNEEEFLKFGSKKINNLDILMTMTGDPPDVGKCNLIRVDEKQILAFNQRVAKLTSKINAYYLFVYLSTEFIRLQSERVSLGIRQRNIGVNDLRGIQVIVPDQDFIAMIEKSIKQYLDELKNSKNLYSKAEESLLEELGLKDFSKESEELSNIINLSETKTANRIDAEYFKPEYEKLLEQVNKHKSKQLGELVAIKKGIEPGADVYQDEGKLFIRVSSLSRDGITDKDQKYLTDDLYQKYKKDYEPQVGEILLTKDATPGIAYAIKDKIDGIISGGILRLQLKEDIEVEYLTLCLNSIIGKMQAERDAGGSIIAHWKPEQIKQVQIPILSKASQQKIADLARASHTARQKAKQLLEEAKQKVENLIEDNNYSKKSIWS